MTAKHKMLFPALTLIFILACSIPAGIPPSPAPDLAGTITAQAALLSQSPAGEAATPIPQANPSVPEVTVIVPSDTPSPTFTSTMTPTLTLTVTPSVPTVSVSADTNCRTGPGKEYDYLGALMVGESAEVVGKNTITGYWIIKNPDRDGVCWLWDFYATVSGDTSKLQEYTIPPTPTPAAPGPIQGLNANKICFWNGATYNLSGFLIWNDLPNESGYNIYLNGGFSNVLAANTTTTAIPPLILVPGGSINMSVEAFNAGGKSARKTVVIVCP